MRDGSITIYDWPFHFILTCDRLFIVNSIGSSLSYRYII